MISLFTSGFRRCLAATTTGLLLTVLASGQILPDREFHTTRTLAMEVSTMTGLLDEVNFNRQAIDNEPRGQLGRELIHDYMVDLDGQRLFFLATDREAFDARYADALYYNLSTLGSLNCAFDIYAQYEKRVQNRVNWIFKELSDHKFDFTSYETYPLDRSKSPWPATESEANDLWRRRIKLELLQDLLNKKTLVQAQKDVHDRYARLLKNLADTDSGDIAELFLTSLAGLYDPHSCYFSAETYEDFSIEMRLSLVGIGAMLAKDDNADGVVVKEIVPGGPADLSKQLHPNDKIIAVAQNGGEPVDIIGMKLRKVVDLIRGNKGTKVTLTIVPSGAADDSVHKEVTLVRDVVKLNSARAHAAIYKVPGPDGKVLPLGVITLPSFYGLSGDGENGDTTQTSATKDVAALIKRLEAAGIKGLVLDLRDNGGGLLSEAIGITGLFINRGPVVQVKSYDGDVQIDNDDDPKVSYTGPLAVLVSRFSASASEIVTGALQDYGRAIIIGDRSTHGKGSVQTIVEMRSVNPQLASLPPSVKTGAAKLTIQKFYLPNGSSTQDKGVTPDIILPSIDEYMPIGESDLPHALAWDEIPPAANFTGHPLPVRVVDVLRSDSERRQKHLAEFAYLRKSVDWFKAKEAMKNISLNLAEREKQKAADDAFKKTMDAELDLLAKSNFPSTDINLVPPPPKPKVAKSDKGTGSDDEILGTDDDLNSDKLDIPLRESLRVLSDVLSLSQNHQYWVDGTAPLTIQASKSG